MVDNVKNSGVDKMTAASIDIDTLDKLFDNQKKLDDVFSSIFDDDDYFLNSSTSSNKKHTAESNDQINSQDIYSNEDYSYKDEDIVFVREKRNIFYVLLPVVAEIAVIYYGIMYFN